MAGCCVVVLELACIIASPGAGLVVSIYPLFLRRGSSSQGGDEGLMDV